MDSNHRCLDVSQESSPLDHGTERKTRDQREETRARFDCLDWLSSLIAPLSSVFSGSRGTRTHKRGELATCFQAVFNYRGTALLPAG